MKLGILFAGQGSQTVGMGQDFYQEHPEFREIFDFLPDAQKNIAWQGPDESLKETKNTQPILLAFGLGVYQVLRKEVLVPRGINPEAFAGLSLGEYTALAASGVWDGKQAVDLVTFRALAMEKASRGIHTVMSAVMGLTPNQVEEACRIGQTEGNVEIANYNCPGQIVLSGSSEGVAAAEQAAKEFGARRCMRLAVSGPFHTSYMKPAGEALAEKFQEIPFGEMQVPVLFNVTGTGLQEGEILQNLLAAQVSSSVRFQDIIENIETRGITHIIEIGPGKALAGFVRKTTKNIKVISIEHREDIEKVKTWIEE